MPLLLRLAIRNLWRNRRRTILTFSALAMGITWLIIIDSLMGGFTEHSLANVINYETGELQVHPPGYFDDRELLPIDRPLTVQPALEALQHADGVRAVSPRVVTSARLNVGWEEFPVIAIGIDPHLDAEAMELSHYVDGRMPSPDQAEAAIGSGLARLLDISTGDWITLITRTRQSAMEAIDLVVVGILNTPNPTVNQNHIYMPLSVADASLDMQSHVTEIIVRLEPGRSLSAGTQQVREVLSRAGIDADVVTWQQSASDFLTLMQTSSAYDMMLVGVILIIALVGVTNTTLLGALERRREIGMMKALGMKEGEIVRLFLLEATGIGVLAVLVGSALGAAANVYLVEVGLELNTYIGDMDVGIPIGDRVYGVWDPTVFLWTGLAGVITCWIASYLPARRAARLDAATTMRQ